MEKTSEYIQNQIDSYFDWLYSLPSVIAALALIATVAIPIILICGSIDTVITINYRNACLDSMQPRRWHPNVCEENIDDKWVEINPFEDDRTYYYNQAVQ
jgi:hypothetical protein